MITICIPTRNRPELLYRALCSIEACNKEKNTFTYKIVVGDASDTKEAVNANKESVKKIALSVNLEYFNHPKLSVVDTNKKMSSLVKTKYYLTIADGGMIINDGVKECINYLEENEDAVAVHGDVVSFTTTNDLVRVDSVKKIRFFEITPLRKLLDDKAEHRFTSLAVNYAPLVYLVTRSDIYGESWKYSTNISNHSIAGEILPTFLTSLYGKIGHVNTMMLARQMHSKRTKLDLISQYIFHKEWSDDYSNLVTTLSTVLSKKDGLSDSLAQKIVSEIMSNYFLTGIRISQLKNTQLKSSKSLVRILLARNLPYNLKILIYMYRLMKHNKVNNNYYSTTVSYIRSYIYLRNILCS